MNEPTTEAALDDLVRIARNGAGDGAANLIQARRAVRVSLDAHPLCPARCGCRIWPDADGHSDADARDCACDGPCCWDSWDDFIFDVLDRPTYYRELYEGSRDMARPFAALAVEAAL